MEKTWRVYLLKCADNTLYCGTSNDIAARLIKHNSGKGAKYTKTRRPVELVAVSRRLSKRDAFRLEHQIKKLPTRSKIEHLRNSGKNRISR